MLLDAIESKRRREMGQRHPIPEDIIQMRVARLLEHGVNPNDARDVAVEQIRTEMAQNLREREARGEVPRADKRDDYAETLAMRYHGVAFEIADSFEKSTKVPHEHGSSRSGRKKRSKPKPFVRLGNPFGE